MGIGLVEVIWKMINTIINSRLRTAILFHVSLHGFSQGRGVGMATVEDKLAQQLAGICHKTLFQVFLNVKKSYNSLYRMRYMEILRGYGIRNSLQRILEKFWEGHVVVSRSGRCYG